MKLSRYGSVLLAAMAFGCGSASTPIKLSTLSGTWYGQADARAIGGCRLDGSPFSMMMTWTVTDAGEVTVHDGLGRGGNWAGTITEDLQLTLKRTAVNYCGFPDAVLTSHDTDYRGSITSEALDVATISGTEQPCPNTCPVRYVWTVTRQP
jgi:hypothetical protein